MARGRFVSSAIAYDPEFNEMSLAARFLFLAAIPHLDRDGLLPAHPSALWSTIAPMQPALLGAIPDAIDAWRHAGMVTLYSTRAGDVLYFVNFHKHQTGMKYDREAPSRFAAYMPQEFDAEIIGAQSRLKANRKHLPSPDLSRDSSPDLGQDPKPDNVRALGSGKGKGKVQVEDQVQDQVQGQGENAKTAQAELAAVFQCYEENMPGALSQIVADDIADLVREHGADNVIRAIGETARNNGRTVRYVAKVLDNWARGQDKPAMQNGNGSSPFAYEGAALIEHMVWGVAGHE